MNKSPSHIRNHIRWHAELGSNAHITLPPDIAVEHMQWRLEAIVRYLDRLDDDDRTERVLALVGIAQPGCG